MYFLVYEPDRVKPHVIEADDLNHAERVANEKYPE